MNESFYRYMMGFLAEDSPEGDLARDMRRSGDETDLTQIRSWDDMSSYLHLQHACPECIGTAWKCWQKYSRIQVLSDNR